MENVLANTEKVKGNKLRENLTIYRQHALLSKDLATIRKDVPINCNILSQPLEITKTPELKEFLMELELRTLIQKLDLEDVETDKQIQTNQRTRKEIVIKTNVELKSLLKQVMEEEEAAVLFYPTFSIAWQTDKVYRISLREDLIVEGLDEEEALQSLSHF